MQNKTLDFRLKIKAIAEDGTFEGYGSVFNVVDSYSDVVLPGAFAKSLEAHQAAGTMPKLLWMHNSAQPIGIFTEMREDNIGLYVKGKLTLEVQQAAEAYALLKAGAIDGLSIGYVPKIWEYDQNKGINYLKELDLWETSLVTFPANTSARINVVKAVKEGKTPNIRELEAVLCDALGFSKRDAMSLLARGYKGLTGECDATDENLEALSAKAIKIADIFKQTTN